MKYYVIAGEASGDLHGSNLIKALQTEDPQADFRAWGGDLMEQAGAQLVKHYRDLAFMGFWEVALNLRTILRNIRFCKQDITTYEPDVLILIDYPGFNLRIAKWAHRQGLRVYYYISPQLWAWHSSRVRHIKASVDRMFVILPFEKDFYAAHDYPVDFVGHPLLDVIEDRPVDEQFRTACGLDERPLVALLPGSRRQEISRMLDVMLQVVPAFPDCQFAIAGAPSIPASEYTAIIEAARREHGLDAAPAAVPVISDRTYDLLQHADAALVTSGTATLETGLFGVPQVVCYRGSALSYHIARRVVNVEYISLVNLILEAPLVEELIQERFTAATLRQALSRLFEPERRRVLREGYDQLRQRLGQAGASRRAAQLMIRYLRGGERTEQP